MYINVSIIKPYTFPENYGLFANRPYLYLLEHCKTTYILLLFLDHLLTFSIVHKFRFKGR